MRSPALPPADPVPLLHRVRSNDHAKGHLQTARPFIVQQQVYGHVLPVAARALKKFDSIFEVTADFVKLRDEHTDQQQRSDVIADVLERLRQEDSVPCLRGWRDELLAVRTSFHSSPVMLIERAAGPLFGIRSYGCFTNGYICHDGQRPTHIWLGRRSMQKSTWPGKLDCIAAGGISAGQIPLQSMVKECEEEAGIPASLSAQLIPVGGVSYTGLASDEWGIKPDFLFTFDLQLEPSFQPVCADGEMESFQLYPISEVVSMLISAEPLFKPNVGVVLVDFLVRHGFVACDEPGYIELVSSLRSGLLPHTDI